MKHHVIKTVFCLLLVSLCILSPAGAVSAATAGAEAPADAVRYVNPDTGYEAVIVDDLGLLNESEQSDLIEDMKPITAYGNIAFWSTDQPTQDSLDQARIKRKELFEYTSAGIFVVNTQEHTLTVQSYGKILKCVTESRARSITKSVTREAEAKEYYAAANKVYRQMMSVIDDHTIPEPLKITGYIIIAIIIGLTLTLTMAFSAKNNPLRKQPDDLSSVRGSGKLYERWKRVKVSEERERFRSGGKN